MASAGQTLPPPGSSDAPNYWMWETSGDLAVAVHQFLTYPNHCTLRQLALLRAYFQQWVDAPVWDQNPSADDESRAELKRLRAQCRGITNVADAQRWIRSALDVGMDPL
jgi:hypothetical protein